MADLIHQWLLTSFSLFTTSFLANPASLLAIIRSDLADIRCGQKSLCRYRYPVIQNLTDQSIGNLLDDSVWNTTAVDDVDSSVSQISLKM